MFYTTTPFVELMCRQIHVYWNSLTYLLERSGENSIQKKQTIKGAQQNHV